MSERYHLDRMADAVRAQADARRRRERIEAMSAVRRFLHRRQLRQATADEQRAQLAYRRDNKAREREKFVECFML